MDFLNDLISFVFRKNKIWLLPSIIILLLIGILIAATSGSAAGSLIYTVF